MGHILVGEAFVNKPQSDEKLEIDHIDGNPLNNHYTNLRWVTHYKNMNNPITQQRIREHHDKGDGVNLCGLARVAHQKKRVYIGRYKDDREKGIQAVKIARAISAGCDIPPAGLQMTMKLLTGKPETLSKGLLA